MARIGAMLSLVGKFENERARRYLTSLAEEIAERQSRWSTKGAAKLYVETVGGLAKTFSSEDFTRKMLVSILRREDPEPSDRQKARRLLVLLMLKVAMGSSFCSDDDLLWFEPRMRSILEGTTRPAWLVEKVILSGIPCRQHALIKTYSIGKEGGQTFKRHYVTAIATDIESESIVLAIEQHLDGIRDSELSPNAVRFFNEFAASLGGKSPDSLLALGEVTLRQQLKYFEGADRLTTRRILDFYRWCAERRPPDMPMFSPRDGITLELLCNHQFSSIYLNGYRAVLRNHDDPVPEADRWFLYVSSPTGRGTLEKPNVGYCIDTTLPDERLQDAFKKWLWDMDATMHTLREMASIVRSFILDLPELPVVLDERGSLPTITFSAAAAVVAKRRGVLNPSSLSRQRSIIYRFLLFAETAGAARMTSGCHLLLGRPASKGNPTQTIEAADKDDLEALQAALVEKAPLSLENSLFCIVFCLTRLTSLRLSEVLDLKITSIVRIAGTKYYGIEDSSKTSRRGKTLRQIDAKTKSLIDDAIELTAGLRETAPEALKPYVFLVDSWRGPCRVADQASYNIHLKKICSEIGIPDITTQNVRKRRKTDARLAAMREGFSQAELKAVAGGSREVEDTHYFRPTTRDYLLAVTGIEIGTEKLAGSIEDEAIAGDDADLVENECGWCRSDACKIAGSVSCLKCKGFWTTPAHIPEFKAMIKAADRKIASCTLEHERTGHLAVKKLAVEWLAALLDKKKEGEAR